MPSILFVCTANQFRSPLAAAIFVSLLRENELVQDWNVESAGTWAEEGLPVHPQAVQAAVKLGLALAAHSSREVNKDLLHKADLIVVMEQGHREALASEFPKCRDRLCILAEIAGDPLGNIEDPARTNIMDADRIAQQIREDVQKAFKTLMDLARWNQAARSIRNTKP